MLSIREISNRGSRIPGQIDQQKQAVNQYDYANIQKAAQSPDEMYVQGDTLYLAGTDWGSSKDYQANIYNLQASCFS